MEDEKHNEDSKINKILEDSVDSSTETTDYSEDDLPLFNSSTENEVPITPINQLHPERTSGPHSLPSSKKKKNSRKRIEFFAERMYDPKQDIFGDCPELNEGDDSFQWHVENNKTNNSVSEIEPNVKELGSAKSYLVDINVSSSITPKRSRKSLVNQKSVSCDKNKITPTTSKEKSIHNSNSERKKTLQSHSKTNIETLKVLMDGYKTLKDVWKRTGNVSCKSHTANEFDSPAKGNCSSNINGIVPLTESPLRTPQHFRSKGRNFNICRKLLIRSPDQGSSPILLTYEQDQDDFSATQPVSTLILKGVNAYVEVRSAGDNRSMGVKAQLQKLGATVSDKFSKEVTHVIFKEGLPSTYKKAIKRNIPIVSVLWIEECKKANVRVSERLFPPHDKEKYESPNPLKKFRKMKSIQPDFDDKCEKNANRKSVKRKSSVIDDGTSDSLYEQKQKRRKSNGSVKKWVANTSKGNGLVETLVNVAGIRQKEFKEHVKSPHNSFPEDVVNSPLAVRLLRQLTSPCLSKETSSTFRTPRTQSKRRKSVSPMQITGEFEQEASFKTPTKTDPNLACNGILTTNERNAKKEISLQNNVNNHPGVVPTIQVTECDEKISVSSFENKNMNVGNVDFISCGENEISVEEKENEICILENLTNKQEINTSIMSESLSNSITLTDKSVSSVPPPNLVEKETGHNLLNESNFKEVQAENENSVVHLSNNSSLPFCSFAVSDIRKEKSDDEFSQCDDQFDFPADAIEECINAISEDSNGENKNTINSHQMEVNLQCSSHITDKSSASDSMRSVSKRKLLPQTHLHGADVFTVVNHLKQSPTPHYVRFRKRASSDPSVQKNKKSIQESVVQIRSSSSEPEIFKKSASRRDTLDLTTIWKQKKIQTKMFVEQPMPTIVCTSLHKTDMDAVISVISKLGSFAIEDKVSALTTHVVSSGPKRTINMLRGISRGCWILRLEWVYKSLEANKWLDEELFEMTEFSTAVQKCRIERESFGPAYKNDLFNSCGAIFIGRNSCPPKVDLEELVKLCGGTVVSAARSADVIVGDRTLMRDVKCVSEKWILDSITHNALGSITDYLLNCSPR